jgi:hypothetical protein
METIKLKRVLVTVRGGVVDLTADRGVQVVVLDYDENPEALAPNDFSDLAEVMGVDFKTSKEVKHG